MNRWLPTIIFGALLACASPARGNPIEFTYASAAFRVNGAGFEVINEPGCSGPVGDVCTTSAQSTLTYTGQFPQFPDSVTGFDTFGGTAAASASFGTLAASAQVLHSTDNTSAQAGASSSAEFADVLHVLTGNGSGAFSFAWVLDPEVGLSASPINGDSAAVSGIFDIYGPGDLPGSGARPIVDYRFSDSDSFRCRFLVNCGPINSTPSVNEQLILQAGDSIYFQVLLSANASGQGSFAADPANLFITAPEGFTFSTDSGANYSSTASPVPEPTSLLLLGSGLAGLIPRARRHFRRR